MHSKLMKILFATLLLAGIQPLLGAEDHSQHQHNATVPPMDASGKRLDTAHAGHHMDDAALAELRKKIALYRALTDAQAHMNMALMGPDYEWYVSDQTMRGDTGVLILVHGVGENSDAAFVDALKPMAMEHPTSVAFGMAMMGSSAIQSAVDDLTARGAKTIVLVPTAMTRYNSLTRQWEYIFGMRDDSSYLDVPRVKTDARVLMTEHYNDHQLITDILLDFTKEKSTNPANEVVILVGHGPEEIEDNGPDLALLQAHVDRIAAAVPFAEVKIINLQDDAYPPIRAANVKKLRKWITTAQRKGQNVIVTVVSAASYGVQAKIREDLRGLDYQFADKGLTEHPKFLQWLQAAVAERLAKDQAEQAAAN